MFNCPSKHKETINVWWIIYSAVDKVYLYLVNSLTDNVNIDLHGEIKFAHVNGVSIVIS